MSRNQPKLKPPPRPFFSCGIFRNCTQSVLSPRTPPTSSTSFLQNPLPPPPAIPIPSSSSSSSSSSASHSFTQWRFPAPPPPPPETELSSAYRASELHFRAGDILHALRLLERSLAAASHSPETPAASPGVMAGVAAALRETETARAAAKVLLAMVLSEKNRRAAVEAGAAAAAVEAVAFVGDSAVTVKERSLAALELICTVEEGAAAVRKHELSPAAIAGAAEGMVGRGRECAIGILAAVYGGDMAAEAPPAVARAVAVGLQGECSVRGRRKGVQLLRAMKERNRLDLADVGVIDC